MNRHITAAVLTLAFVSRALAQDGPAHPPVGPAPLLHVRLNGPRGTHVTLYPGQAPARDFEAPVGVGLRPGYVYRIRLHHLADFPDVAIYPTLEVRGSLELPPGVIAANYPAPVTLTDNDIRRALAGALVTKVIYLEHPERAAPTAAKPGEALESELPANRDVLDESRALGRPVAVLRLGERTYTAEELAAESIPGTIQLPGETGLARAARPPYLPWACVRVYDPILGRRHPEEECLHDGGDVGRPIGIGPDGRLGGLDPTDSVAEYTDSTGRRAVAKSNRVCICVPRFAVLRNETPIAEYGTALRVDRTAALLGRAVLQACLPSGQTQQVDSLAGMQGRLRASGTQTALSLSELGNATTTTVVGRTDNVNVIGAICVKPEQPRPDKPLILCKSASASAAQVGDVITFYLKYSNCGGQPISNVAVNDSLTGRLEYIPGTAKSDRDAVFTTQPNEAGSVILRWEVSGELQPGTSGLLSFQARVR